MGIQIVSLFPTCTQCNETEDRSVGLYLYLDEKDICSECREEPIDAEIDESLTLERFTIYMWTQGIRAFRYVKHSKLTRVINTN